MDCCGRSERTTPRLVPPFHALAPLRRRYSPMLMRFLRRFSPQSTRRATRKPRLELLEDRCVPATLLAGFGETAVGAGITNATAMEVAPNGDVWVLEQGGLVKRFVTGSLQADVVGNLAGLGLDAFGERGL